MHRLFVLIAALSLAACQPAVAPVGAVTVENAVARPPLGGQTTGAAYLVIRNSGAEADRLIGASSPVANPVELHTHTSVNGVMRMDRVEAIDVPVGGEVVFAPRGLHLMLFNFQPAGETAPVTLRFEKAGEMTVDFAVKPLGQP